MDKLDPITREKVVELAAQGEALQEIVRHDRSRTNMLRILVGWVFLVTVLGFIQFNQFLDSQKERRAQFCRVINEAHADQVKRYKDTLVYLSTDAGREQTGINQYIRANLPTQRRDVIAGGERVPTFCGGPKRNEV